MALENATLSMIDALHETRTELTTLRLVIMHILLSHREDKELIKGIVEALTELRDSQTHTTRDVISDVLNNIEALLGEKR